MLEHDRRGPFDRFLSLMDQAQDAIDRRDLASVGVLEREVAALTAEMQTAILSAAGDPSASPSVVDMESPMRQALERVMLNQMRLAGWLKETGVEMTRLQEGAVATRSYTAAVPLGPSLFEREA
jgi:hypothetical protein